MFSISRHQTIQSKFDPKRKEGNTQVETIMVAVVFSKGKSSEKADGENRILPICYFAIILLTYNKSLDKEERNGER